MEEAIKEAIRLINLMRGQCSDETLAVAVEGTNVTKQDLLSKLQADYNMKPSGNHPAMGKLWNVTNKK